MKADGGALANICSAQQRDGHADAWLLALARMKASGRREGMKKRARDRRNFHKQVIKKLPQYALDGKSRKGCESSVTGRTEIDLRLYCPDTKQVLAQKTLPDKEGEAVASAQLIERHASKLTPGIFTGDAGITSPDVVSQIVEAGQHYLLGLKGNAGHVFDIIHAYPWDKVERKFMHFSQGHGREEIRTLKSLRVANFCASEAFEKYRNVAVVFQLTTSAKHVRENEYTISYRYFIGDEVAQSLTLPAALAYIRHHWGVESYHWIRDAVLREDASQQRARSGSRFLGALRTAVHQVGTAAYGSVKAFLDHFSANPEGTSKRV